MKKSATIELAFACLIGCGSVTLAVQPSFAQSGNTTVSPAQIDALVADIKAHKELCDKVTPDQTKLYQQCSNEKAQLVARQKNLGLTDDALNAKLTTRGWRWP